MAIEMFDLAGADEALRFSPYCWRTRMALAHKGLDVSTVPVRFGEKHKIEFSGQKLVPVIRDGSKVVSDSWAIAEYLDSAYPDRPALFPAGSKPLTSFVRHWTQTRLSLPLMRVMLMDIYETIDPADRDYFRASREQRFGKKLEEMMAPEEGRTAFNAELAPAREVLKETPFLNGEAPAFADYCLFGIFMFARGVSPRAKTLLDAGDSVYTWRERMLDLHGGLARKAPDKGA